MLVSEECMGGGLCFVFEERFLTISSLQIRGMVFRRVAGWMKSLENKIKKTEN